jgi:hypothetical protein
MEAMGISTPPSRGEGVAIPRFSTDLMRALQPFWTSILVNRGTRPVHLEATGIRCDVARAVKALAPGV